MKHGGGTASEKGLQTTVAGCAGAACGAAVVPASWGVRGALLLGGAPGAYSLLGFMSTLLKLLSAFWIVAGSLVRTLFLYTCCCCSHCIACAGGALCTT